MLLLNNDTKLRPVFGKLLIQNTASVTIFTGDSIKPLVLVKFEVWKPLKR